MFHAGPLSLVSPLICWFAEACLMVIFPRIILGKKYSLSSYIFRMIWLWTFYLRDSLTYYRIHGSYLFLLNRYCCRYCFGVIWHLVLLWRNLRPACLFFSFFCNCFVPLLFFSSCY